MSLILHGKDGRRNGQKKISKLVAINLKQIVSARPVDQDLGYLAIQGAPFPIHDMLRDL